MSRKVVWLLVASELKRSWRALLGLALVVGLLGTVVLATAAGARRTASALDRAREHTAASDLRVQVDAEAPVVAEVAEALAASPAVDELARVRTFVVDAGGEYDLTLVGDPDGRRGFTMDRPVSLEGRLPAAGAADEVALNQAAASSLGLGIGDVLSLGTFSPEDVEALLTEDQFTGFNGPELDLQIVGVHQLLEDLQGGATFAGPQALVGPAFFTEHADVGGFPEVFSLRLADPETGAAEVEEIVTGLAGDADVSTSDAESAYVESITRAIDVLTAGLLVFALVAAAAGLVVVGQAVTRQVHVAAGNGERLKSIGLSRRSRAAAAALPALVAVAAGAAVAGLGSLLASPLFPIGLGRSVEAEPGIRLDPAVAIGGALLLAALVGCLVALRSWREQPGGEAASTSRLSEVVSRRVGDRPVPFIGSRLALEPGRGRTAVPVRSAVVGAAIGVLGVVGVGVVAVSLQTLVDEPARWGWTWSSEPEYEDPDLIRETIGGDERLAGAAFLDQTYLDLGGVEATGFALEALRGDTALAVRRGRAPTSASEIALGHQTAEDLDVSVGDVVHAPLANGEGEQELTVVGEVVFPISDNASPGEGGLLTPDGLDRVRGSDGFESLLLTYPEGVPRGPLEQELAEDYGLSFSAYSRPSLPGEVSNLDGVRSLTIAIGGFFVLLAVVGLGHLLALSSRRRRFDFAVLRALGLRRRQVRGSVVVQAVVIGMLGLAVGLPLGLVVGRLSWRMMVANVGVVDDPTQPWVLLAVILPVVLLLAAAVALVPAWNSAPRRPADALRSE